MRCRGRHWRPARGYAIYVNPSVTACAVPAPRKGGAFNSLSLFAIAHSQLPQRGSLNVRVLIQSKSLPHRGRWILRSKRRREFIPSNPFRTSASLASLSSLSRYLSGFFQGRWQGRKILSSLSALTCAVKLRLCVVGAVIGGPPVAMLFMSTPFVTAYAATLSPQAVAPFGNCTIQFSLAYFL